MYRYLRVSFRPDSFLRKGLLGTSRGEQTMPKGFRHTALHAFAALVLAIAATVTPASAQFPPTPDEQDAQPLAGTPKKRNVPPPAVGGAGPNILGNWTGQLTQVGSTTP